ncbi:hypothetical protein LWI29_026051 [Acer saccharum]|uniref:Serine carboxypeptidase n=1 Tax=Acer saccharum TaxID=4024 RepID=A0AA39VJK1_ACESA|nr:hypothetical protein LWI29_026051 [Acer saccharum]
MSTENFHLLITMVRNYFNDQMLQLIEEEEEDDDYGILLGMAAVEGERLAIESWGPRRGGSVPSHAIIDRNRVEDMWVGDLDELQLFYYFIESERNPVRDPLLLWLTGGPGCSGSPVVFEVDAPVGTGFSYSKTQKGWYSSDTLSTKAIYEFIQKWIMDHPKFSNNPLYITGDSYSGMIVPMVSLEIAIGNMAKHQPYLHFQGYMVGNPVTDLHDDENSRVKYFHRVGLISTELYESAKQNCGEEYIHQIYECRLHERH